MALKRETEHSRRIRIVGPPFSATILQRAGEAPPKLCGPMPNEALEFASFGFGHYLEQGGPQHKTAPVGGTSMSSVIARSGVPNQLGDDSEELSA